MEHFLKTLLILGVTASAYSVAFAAEKPLLEIQESKIAQVKSGAQKTANATWWGFDKEDATESLQNAINSGASTLIVENTGHDWIIDKPIKLASNQEIIFEDGVVIQAKEGAFKGGADSLFTATELSNITLTGKGKVLFRMRRDDYANPKLYRKAEWRNGIRLQDCKDITIRGITVTETGGDGLYLGASADGYNENILVEDCIFDKNYRQGISVISAKDLIIRRTKLTNTKGTAPAAGIDFEPNPNKPGQRIVNCVLEDVEMSGNAGAGFQIYASFMKKASHPVSITVRNSKFSNNKMAVIDTTTTTSTTDIVQGKVLFENCQFDNDAIRLRNPIINGLTHEFRKSTFVFQGDKTPKGVIELQTYKKAVENPVVGGIIFDDSRVISDKEIAPFILRFGVPGTTLSEGFIRKALVEINGKPMFFEIPDFSGKVLFEINGKSTSVDIADFIAQKRRESKVDNPVRSVTLENGTKAQEYDLTKKWAFLPESAEEKAVISPDFNDEKWKVVNAGAWWQDQGFDEYHGTAWYRKTIDLPKYNQQKVLLSFEGVDGSAVVYLNGKKAGEHILGANFKGWDEPFNFDVTEILRSGKNIIAVQVTSKSEKTASGIHKPVYLIVESPQ